MASFAKKGKACLESKDYAGAITNFTAALKTSNSPAWFIDRATAYQRAKKYDLALEDAANAVYYSTAFPGRTEHLAPAHYRRALAYHSLGQYGNARICLNWVRKYNEKLSGLSMMTTMVSDFYEKAGGETAECNKITVVENPGRVEQRVIEEPEVTKDEPKEEEKKPVDKGKGIDTEGVVPVKKETVPKAPTATPKEKIRHEWYQSPSTITIEILAKGVPKDKAEIDIQEGQLDVSFPVAGSSSTYVYSLNPLFAKIDKSKSTSRITPHKIEIILHKSVAGKWLALEGTEPIASTESPEDDQGHKEDHKEEEKPPAYPSSSRTGPKNWDTLVDEKDVSEEADTPDDFFKVLYSRADPDTRRAMMKSYMESGGTSLSTSWEDAKNKEYKVDPPDGMEAKKWEI